MILAAHVRLGSRGHLERRIRCWLTTPPPTPTPPSNTPRRRLGGQLTDTLLVEDTSDNSLDFTPVRIARLEFAVLWQIRLKRVCIRKPSVKSLALVGYLGFSLRLHVCPEANNGGHNPVAEVDSCVSKRAIGDLGSWLGSSESRIDRRWITTAIQDCDHVYKLSRNQIVDRVRETFRQRSVETSVLLMNAAGLLEFLDVFSQAFQKILIRSTDCSP